jgi:hypothetical protein
MKYAAMKNKVLSLYSLCAGSGRRMSRTSWAWHG